MHQCALRFCCRRRFSVDTAPVCTKVLLQEAFQCWYCTGVHYDSAAGGISVLILHQCALWFCCRRHFSVDTAPVCTTVLLQEAFQCWYCTGVHSGSAAWGISVLILHRCVLWFCCRRHLSVDTALVCTMVLLQEAFQCWYCTGVHYGSNVCCLLSEYSSPSYLDCCITNELN